MKKMLLTGATGYVGGKLLKRLQLEGNEINCLVRNPSKLNAISAKTHVFQGDLMYRSSMWRSFQGVETAYYLVHSLADPKKDFESCSPSVTLAHL